jgi:murein DD-endopeptidase MepM/ murein hydrolase activator NlpD
MSEHGKHRRSFQILVIPDDKDEPKAYIVPVGRIKFYKILAIVLGLHILLGLFSYYQFFHLTVRNRQLLAVNRELEQNNNDIFALQEKLIDLEASMSKIRTPLGLDERALESLPRSDDETIMSYVPNLEAEPARTTNVADEGAVKAQIGFLERSKSIIHNIEKSTPTYLPVEGRLTQDFMSEDFGLDPAGGHYAIDIAAESGSPVKAAADGVVLFAGWTQDLGNLLIVLHGHGFYTLYGHNQQILHQRNAFVKKGQVIALVGNSGKSSAPHLHFEIWNEGVPLDPKKYILAFQGF